MSKIDRLTALLNGLSPRVELSENPTGFAIYIIARDELSDLGHIDAKNFRLLLCPSMNELKNALSKPSNEGWRVWMAFKIHFEGPVASLIFTELTESVLIYLEHAESSLIQIVQLVAQEVALTRCGQTLLMERAGDIMLIAVMRQLVAQPYKNFGLFSALAHPRIAKSVVAMHSDINKDWSLELLAEEANMSRTAFATQFKAIMKISPGKYLEALRLCSAKKLLDVGKTLKYAASKTGYASASTLARAMSRQRDSL
ncbi:helix-turn-helix domain-containing protein [Shewanella mangrovi]|uniref:helix-turn-helix domain-containing protein n=1 Tax=Shewanella mangrovi TaxID=1515746 RepID=UPI00068F5263|nr:helix-turn-helix domain-containing protein [Shewanella mangrovi]